MILKMNHFLDKFLHLHRYKRLFTLLFSPFFRLKKISEPTIYMTLYVKDEEDIIENNLKFHHALGIDGFIVTDNGSQDNTINILRKYEEKGWIKEIIVNTSLGHPQDICVDNMIRLARKKYHADWVINADADEFWWSPSKNLKKTMENYTRCNIIYVKLRNVLPEKSKKMWQWNKMIFQPIDEWEREGLSKCSLFSPPWMPKVIHRTQYYQKISRGNHQVQMLIEKKSIAKDIVIYHYSIRSYQHFERKVIRGGLAYLNNPNKSLGVHWRYWYSLYLENALKREYNRVVGSEHLTDFQQRGIIKSDNEYLHFLKQIES